MDIIPDSVELVTHNRNDFLRGFVTYRDNEKGFLCIKIVKVSEVTNFSMYNVMQVIIG